MAEEKGEHSRNHSTTMHSKCVGWMNQLQKVNQSTSSIPQTMTKIDQTDQISLFGQ